MRDSIFDPENPKAEHSGSRYLGQEAQDPSQMPANLIDGKVDEAEAADLRMLEDCADCPGLPGLVAPFDHSGTQPNSPDDPDSDADASPPP